MVFFWFFGGLVCWYFGVCVFDLVVPWKAFCSTKAKLVYFEHPHPTGIAFLVVRMATIRLWLSLNFGVN